MKKKILSILLAVGTVLTMMPTVAWASETGTFGDFTVTYSGAAPIFADNTLILASAGESYTVGMAEGKTSTSNLIMVSANNVTLNLSGVTISAPDYSGGSALTVTGSGTTLNVITNSSLTGGLGRADPIAPGNGGNGISGNVSITGTKTLTTNGGAAGAGAMGSSNGGNGISGDVSISGTATVNANGGINANAGGGDGGEGINGNVTATGAASLTATGGMGPALAPSGASGNGISGDLTVTDIATVSLTGGESGGYSSSPGFALAGTLTADGFIIKGGYTGLTDDITPSDARLNQFRYIAVFFPKATEYAVATPAAASGTDYELDTGSKTLIIKTAKGAAFWSASGTAYLDYAVKLANDIDVSVFQWTPVGSWKNAFTGTFDGQGHSIAHLTVHETSNHAGFFGQTSGSTIKNLCIASGTITTTIGGESYAGSIVGNANNTTILNCGNHADVFCTNSSASQTSAGGIAGNAYKSIITNCYNTGNITAACTKIASYAGGIMGQTSYGAYANCYSTGTLSARGATSNYAGGLFGYASYDGSITNCYSKQGPNLKGYSKPQFIFTGCGTFADDGGALTAGTAANCGTEQTLANGSTLLAALNGWVNATASTDYFTWKADDTAPPANGGYPVLGQAYAPPALTGTVTISGTQKYGETLTAVYASGNNTGILSYQWKRGSTSIGTGTTYKIVKDDINNTLTCEVKSTAQTGSVTSSATDEIAKADGPAVTGVSAVGCTTSSNDDGKLTGVTTDMEYKKSGDTGYTAGTGDNITGLASGDYLVRVKETETNSAGADKTFTVDAKNEASKKLISITAPLAITDLANGTNKTAAALGLPETVELTTDCGNVTARVKWDVADSNYDKSKTTEQTFTVNGTVTLPAEVVNTNHLALTTTIRVTVKAESGGDTTPKTITGFLMDYTTKTVPYGTSFASLNLPDKVKAVGNELGGLWIKVTEWLHSSYQSNIPGTYTLTAVLDSGHTGSGYVDSGFILGSGVTAPNIRVTVQEKRSNSNQSDSKNTSSSPVKNTDQTETKVDPTGNTATVTTKPDSVNTNGDTASIETTISSVTVDNTQTATNGSVVDTTKKSAVTINVPTETIVQQLAAKKNVDLIVTVPHDVAKNAIGGAVLTINANKEILEAARATLADVTIKIKDADTQQLAYTWTFKGADLAKSTTPITNVNISMSVHLTTEVPRVNAVTPSNKGLVLSFDHSGALPSVARVQFSALEKGFKPGQTLYFYYYNPTTRQIESQGSDAYVVDGNGTVTVNISHCSDYVLLPKAARTITLDTRTYTMKPKKSYEIGVTLTGVSNTTIKAYSSTKGVANVTVLKNGNVRATGAKPGLTYIMIDVYDSKNRFLTHASVRLTVQNGVKENGNSARQHGLF